MKTMIDEIEFRGWKKEGGWIFGDLLYHSNYRNGKFPTISNELVSRPIEVVPESVGQFTGHKDKNSDKVFEGDILSDSWIVVYNVPESKWEAVYNNMSMPLYMAVRVHSVIGTIYENKELLESK